MWWDVPLDAWRGEPCFILGGGPSIKDFDFDRLRGRGRVIAVNNAFQRAPWADAMFFADTRWFLWNHPFHFDGWKITRANKYAANLDIKSLRFMSAKFSYQANAVGGWCGGSSAVNLAYLLGCPVIVLLGFDMRPGNWHDLHKRPPIPGQHRDKFIPTFEIIMEPALTAAGVTVINTNPRSALRCFPFTTIEEILGMDNIATIERDKYLSIWQRDEYRKVSPGLLEYDRAKMVMDVQPGQTLIDFGAGPGRATKAFQNAGLKVIAVDIAANALETDVPFVEACLWSLPDDLPRADFGYCCDVMEHIPTDHVDDVLSNISDHARACYFRIATRPDRMGPKLIGHPLHLTVEDGEWWRRTIERFWPIVDVVEQTERDIMILARP